MMDAPMSAFRALGHAGKVLPPPIADFFKIGVFLTFLEWIWGNFGLEITLMTPRMNANLMKVLFVIVILMVMLLQSLFTQA